MQNDKKNRYFQQLNQALRNYERAIPSLLLDLDKLDENIAVLKGAIPTSMAFRIVVKSLPSLELVEYIMEKATTNKLMVFHQPFLTHLSAHCHEKTDILLGKPMPIKTAAYYLSLIHI